MFKPFPVDTYICRDSDDGIYFWFGDQGRMDRIQLIIVGKTLHSAEYLVQEACKKAGWEGCSRYVVEQMSAQDKDKEAEVRARGFTSIIIHQSQAVAA